LARIKEDPVGSVSRYLRQNVLGLVAIFLALNAGAYAAATSGDSGSSNKTVFNQDLASSSVDSRVLAAGAVTGPDIAAAAVGPHKMKLDQLVKFLQTRVNGACPDTQLVQAITPDGNVTCAPAGAGTITGVEAGNGLAGGGDQGDVSLAIDPTVVQGRVTGNCTGNNAVKSVAEDGSVACQPTGTGSVNSVDSGFGLTGGPITDTGTLAADPTVLQRRVSGTCTTNNAVKSVAQDGTVGCGSFVTGVTAGTGLSGGTISNSGTISVDPAVTQSRVSGSCSGTQAVQSVAQNGTVGCSTSLASGSGRILTPAAGQQIAPSSGTWFSPPGFTFTVDCSGGDAELRLSTDSGNAAVAVSSQIDGSTSSIPFVGVISSSGAVIAQTGSVASGQVNAEINTGPLSGQTLSFNFYLVYQGGGSPFCQSLGSGIAS
jgi:hypothetical protein